MNRLIAIVGPTGIGKSKLALRLAKSFNGEIVSADSRQVYRDMDIGTGKPSQEELSLVHHHLINIVNLDEAFTLSQYQALAYQAIKDIQQRGKLPFLVGGSGLYVKAVLEGWRMPQVPPDAEFRQHLERKVAESGAEGLYRTLVEIDPEAAKKIDPRNVRRIIRALEVYRQTSTPFSQLTRKEAPSFKTFVIGLTAERAELYRRIDQRVDDMIKRGLVAEVENLLRMGYDFNLSAMSGIGYKQTGQFLRGELTLDEAVEQIKFETHRFVRHQYTWFQLTDRRIHWFDVTRDSDTEIEAKLAEFLNKSGTGD